MNSQVRYNSFTRVFMPFVLFICFIILYIPAIAQEEPPKPIKVTIDPVQNLNFGTFCVGLYGNGSVIIFPSGSRSTSGDVVEISSSFSAALYYVEAIPGTLITIVNGGDITLDGSNGGNMTLHIGDSSPQSPFITTGASTPVTIGGTLLLGSPGPNTPGNYSGDFEVIFIQQ